MIFKNLSIFRTGKGVSQGALNDFLANHKFQPCLPSQESSAGFTTLFGLDTRVFSVKGCHLFCLKVDEKVIPPASVKAEFMTRRKKSEETLGRKLTPAERDELRSEARSDLCEIAFCRPADVWAYLDSGCGFLVINTTSAKIADGLAQTLRAFMPGSDVQPLLPSTKIPEAMTSWLKNGRAPAPFVFGSKCEITDGEGVIRYKDRFLDDPRLQEYLREGLLAESLSLVVDGRFSFVLTKDFVVKEFSIHEGIIGLSQAAGMDPIEVLSNEFQEMITQVRALIAYCEDAI